MSHELFKRYEAKKREEFETETGRTVPPTEELLTDRSAFEHQEAAVTIELSPGILLEKGHLMLGKDGSFANYYDITCDTGNGATDVQLFSRNTPLHMKRMVQNDPDVIAATNGGFFFLSDESPEGMIENSNYQLDIRNGVIHGLPVADRPFLYLENGELQATEMVARGILTIDEVPYSWRGSRSAETASDGILYTAASGAIVHEPAPHTGSRRVTKAVTTPTSSEVLDVIIAKKSAGQLFVQEIVLGGGSSVYAGIGVLQLPATTEIVPGTTITIPQIDTLDLSSVTTGFSIGPSVAHFTTQSDHEINHDASLGSNPPLGTNRIARTIIYKDVNGQIHSRLFDGVPTSDICRGITPNEVATLFETIPTEWAYHLDGGQSAKVVTREALNEADTTLHSYGNKHYVRWPNIEQHPYLWDPDGGRKVPNGILFKRKNKSK